MLGPAGLSPQPLLLPVVTCLSQEASCQGGESQELLISVPEGLTREVGVETWWPGCHCPQVLPLTLTPPFRTPPVLTFLFYK